VLPHQLCQNLILALDLFLQVLDAFLFGLMGSSRPGLEGRRPVLEELLPPAVEEDRRLQPQFVTEPGDLFLLQQMAPQNGNVLFCVYCFRAFLTRSLRYLNGRTLSPFPAEAEHPDSFSPKKAFQNL
jgi:hypothetical protein